MAGVVLQSRSMPQLNRRSFIRTATAAGLLAVANAAPSESESSARFLKAHGNHLSRDGRRFRNVGVNIPDLFERFLKDDDANARKTLERAASIGARMARCF